MVVLGIAQYSIIPGISVSSFAGALLFSFVLAGVNVLVRPLLFILTLPITLLTLGLFSFVLNALMFLFASTLVSGVVVAGFLPAFLCSLLVSLISSLANKLP